MDHSALKKIFRTITRNTAVMSVVLAVFISVFSCTTHNIYADGFIGDINGIECSSFQELLDKLANCKNKSATITMYRDWDAAKDSQFNKRIEIPSGCTAVFNMRGHMFNRNNTWNDDDFKHGDLFYLNDGSSLTINGARNDEDKNTVHENVAYFNGIKKDKAEATKTVKGAVLTGGNSNTGAGCIEADNGKDIILNDVTIIGCKAESWNFCGSGGAIRITRKNTTVTLNNSSIIGCLAEDDGGAIYGQNYNDVKIILNNAHIDENYANDDGGGINLDGENVSIEGKNGSSINKNKCVGLGGGVYFWNDNATIKCENFGEFAVCENSGKRGGGIYVEEEDTVIEGLEIKKNSSSEEGGGIYINNDNTQIKDCWITNNTAGADGGGGVFVEDDCDVGMVISGKTVIRENSGGNLTIYDNSSYIQFDPNTSAGLFGMSSVFDESNTVSAMDIHMGYVKNPSKAEGYDISNTQTRDYSDILTADDNNYTIVYNYNDYDQDDGRRLRYIKKSDENDKTGHRRTNPDVETIHSQDAHAYSAGKVFAGGYTSEDGGSGKEYELREVFAHHGSNDFQCYYSDGFFFDDPIIYNNHLATASWSLASAGGYLGGYDYPYRHAAARQFMADIGCPDQMIYVNDANTVQPGTDTIGITFGSKVLQEYDGNQLKDTDYILIAIAFRGHNYEKEWASNVTIGDGSVNDGEALGFSQAADQAMDSLEYYIERYGLQDKIADGKVKFWLSGFSRAGAATNLTSKRIIEKYCFDLSDPNQKATGNEVFSYPLEAPRGGTDNAEKLSDKTKYFSIHNVVNTGDIVPYVGPEEMGFKRYGVDHFIPGTYFGKKTRDQYLERIAEFRHTPKGASKASGITSVTTYRDNMWLDTKKEMDSKASGFYTQYVTRRSNMIRHLAVIDHDVRFTDYFHPYATKIIPDFLYGKEGDFDGAKLERFLQNFMAFLQQEAFDKSDYRIKYFNGLQAMARAFFAEDMEEAEFRKFNAIKSGVKKIIESDIIELSRIINVLGDYFNMNESQRNEFKQILWDLAKSKGAFDELKSGEIDTVKEYWSAIVDAVFNFADGDWRLGAWGQGDPVYPSGGQWVNGNIEPYGGSASDTYIEDKLVYSLTLYMNVDMIINTNHDRNVGSAWTRTYDSYYSKDVQTGELKDNTYKEYRVNWVYNGKNLDLYSVDYPSAFIENDDQSGYTQLKEANKYPDDKYNYVDPHQKIYLEVGAIHGNVSPADVRQGDGDVIGEAIYYDLYDVTDEENPSLIQGEQLYRGGVYLPLNKEDGKYMIETYARSLGVVSEKSVYYFTSTIEHKVTINDGSDESITQYYESGDEVTVSAKPDSDEYFVNWKVELYDDKGNKVEDDIAAIILNNKQSEAAVTFTMPEDKTEYQQDKSYPRGYGLLITANVEKMIKKVKTDVPVPVVGEGQSLVGQAVLTFDESTDPHEYPIVWTYTYGDKTYPATDTVYSNVKYTATITVPKDQTHNIVFAPTEMLTAEYTRGLDKIDAISISRNDADGSVTLVIKYLETAGDDPLPPEAIANIQVKAYDLNLKEYIKEIAPIEYSVQLSTDDFISEVTITAPDVDNEIFARWDFSKAKGIVAKEGELPTNKTITIVIPKEFTGEDIPVIDAQYIPVISSISAVIEAPEPEHKMQMSADEDTLKVVISNEYQIHKDYIDIDWSPEPIEDKDGNKVADYLKSYTVTIKLVPKEDEHGKKYIEARKTGETDYIRTAAIFNYSESVISTIHYGETAVTAQLDKANNAVSYTFPMTMYTLEKIYPPKDITGIPYGAGEDEVKNRLPSAVDILLNNGKIITASVSWGKPEPEPDPVGDEYSSKTWLTDGTVVLPYGVKKKTEEQSLNVVGKAIVDAAESVEKAVSSLEPGEYLYDQETTLSCETDGATIYYTVGSDPDYHNWSVYAGSPITISRSDAIDGVVTLRTIAVKEGMRPSTISSFSYEFINGIEIPEGYVLEYNEKPQVGVKGGMFYVLEKVSEGVTIDGESGDALAEDPGVYEVKAKVNDGFRWIIHHDDGSTSTTTEDQIISFTITGKDKKIYSVCFDPNGGTVYGSSSTVIKEYSEGTEITIPQANKDGYSFQGWLYDKDKDPLKPNAKYTVNGNTIFTAQWERCTYTVDFELNGGTGSFPPVTVVGDSIIEKPVNDPVKDKCVFDGWYADSSFTKKWNFKTDTVKDNMTLYARYKFSVEFRDEDKLIKTISVYDDSRRINPWQVPQPERLGLDFDFWAKASGKKFDFETEDAGPGLVLMASYFRYEYLGSEQTWILEDSGDLFFRFIRYQIMISTKESALDLKDWFEKGDKQLFVDEQLLDQKDYQYDRGSLLIYLHDSYLNSLSLGKHILTVRFPDGEVSADFFVKERTKPSTPDYVPPRTGE